jgi:CBS domain-containing protein
MCAKGVRRAPIVNQDGKVVGIASVDDLILLLADELGSIAKIIHKQISR